MESDRRTGSTSRERWRTAFRYLLLLGWMALIFRLSATPDLRTVPLAQRFHLLPAVLGVEMTNLLEFVLRKAAHMAAFGVLAWLSLSAFAATFPAWPWRRLLALAFCFTVLYAASDEWHQTFVPTRQGSLRDVAIDASGALIALMLLQIRRRVSAK
ncbi:MAG TPA: VanZ family protein [Symbiobacteriaceae bacterium]|nr:VanZ family protein [Symbiobacteriaceae bacterium]